jgi:hypothetical protein
MNPSSLECGYTQLLETLNQNVSGLACDWPAFAGFWDRWTKEHLIVARSVSSRNVNAWQDKDPALQWAALLKLRQRLVSTLGQGLNANDGGKTLRISLSQLLAEHDKGFVDLLQNELEHVREQMTHAFAIRKTVAAYAQTAQFRGE